MIANRQTLAVVALGLVLRLFIIFPGPFAAPVEMLSNKADLRNYYWPAQTALKGENPYVLWWTQRSDGFRADLAPLELLLFTATVAVWNDLRAIQLLFALFDALNIALLGALFVRSRLRLPFQLFYALGPLTVYNLVLVPQDKTILLTLTFVIFILLTRLNGIRHTQYEPSNHPTIQPPNYQLLIIILAALLATFKWLSAFYILPLLLYVSNNPRAFFKYAALFAAIVALGHLPWFPSWSVVYEFRASRVVAPSHIAATNLLREIGWFDSRILAVGLAVSLAIVYALFWRKRVDLFETIALAAGAGIFWTPDMDPVHLAIIVLHLLLVFDWSGRSRPIWIWLLGFGVSAVYAISTHEGFARRGLPDLRALTGGYGSTQMILLSFVLFVGVFALYLFDKARGRAVGQSVQSA